MNPSIALCMIVKNEERFLEECISSVKNKVDEVIIVDTGSEDRTVEIAKSAGAKVYHYEWINDFSAARNFSLDKATSDYILVLDADEWIDESVDFQKEISKGKDYYSVRIKNYQEDGNAIFHKSIRFFKRSTGLRYFGKLHEHLNIQDNRYLEKESESDILLHHYGYLQKVKNEKNKNERNFLIMQSELEENQNGYTYMNMGLAYSSNNEYEKALDCFIKAYNLGKNNSYVFYILINMVKCLIKLEKYKEAINVLNDSIQVHPTYTDFHFYLGLIYEEIGLSKEAEEKYLMCIELGDSTEDIATAGAGSYLAYLRIAKIYIKRRDYGKAFDFAFNAIEQNPKYRPAITLYIGLMVNASIPHEDVHHQIKTILMTGTLDKEDLQNIILSLYEVRHPILYRMALELRVPLKNEFELISHLYNKEYQTALKKWKNSKDIPEDLAFDTITLALILKESELINALKEKLNLSLKEYKTLKKILTKQSVKPSNVTKKIGQVLIHVSERLIILNEIELLEYLISIILSGEKEVKVELARLLDKFYFTDLSLEILSEINKTVESDTNLLTAEILLKKGLTDEAITYYKRALKSNKDNFKTIDRLYIAYMKKGDTKSTSDLVKVIKSEYPKATAYE